MNQTKKRVIIVHQWMAGPDGDWRPWLQKELEKLGHEVLVPQMPDMDTPVIEKWVGKLAEIVGQPNKNTYFIGHSIGCQTILRYLETIAEPVGGAIFVAGWFNLENLEDEEVVRIARPWIQTKIDIKKVKTVLPKSTLIISNNDPFGYFEENKAKFAKIVTDTIVVPNGGHLSANDGFMELPVILEEFKKLTS